MEQSIPEQEQDGSSEEEEITIKNIDTGEIQDSNQVTKGLSPFVPHKQVWQQYFSSLKKLEDKLLQLVMKKDHSALLEILTQFPIQLSQIKYLGGWNLLHFAVSISDHVAADTLIKYGIDPNGQTTEMKRTALHEATLSNKVDMVELLIGWGADPNLCDLDRNTAMHFAVDYGYCQVVKSLISSSAVVDLNVRNNTNMTPFNTCRSPQIFEILIAYNNRVQKQKSKQSKDTNSSQHHSHSRNTYQSRLIIRNSQVIPHTSRADMVEKFLSLRVQPQRKQSNNDNESIISEQSYSEESLSSSRHNLQSPKKEKKKMNKIGSKLRSSNIKSSFRIASQNIGLMRQSIMKTHLEHEEAIESYDKLRVIGNGSFATVYLVRKKRSSTLLALKAIDKVRVFEDKLHKYIYAERQALTQISHPFILHASYFLQDFTHLYILTQFCPGGDLERIVRKSPFQQNIVKTYLCEAALALEELHRNKILYRDLKTANTFLDAKGHLRLADFGLAKKATISNSFLGSMNYLAPQMLVKGQFKPHGQALDWYLLGVFGYELLHGHPPFYCQDREQSERRVLQQLPDFDPKLSKECIVLLLKLLQKDSTKRLIGLSNLKQSAWFQGVDWQAILASKGQVYLPQVQDLKQLRKKQYFQQPNGDPFIDDRIEWFQNWNYPPHVY